MDDERSMVDHLKNYTSYINFVYGITTMLLYAIVQHGQSHALKNIVGQFESFTLEWQGSPQFFSLYFWRRSWYASIILSCSLLPSSKPVMSAMTFSIPSSSTRF